jgi:choline dehydrogenase-like flavoprotein
VRHNEQDDFAEQARINQKKLSSELRTRFDYVVCGAGTSGSVVAARLAADPNTQVLLLEAGGDDETELITNPNHWPMTLGTELDWGIGLSMVRAIGDSAPLRPFTGREVAPGAINGAELERFFRDGLGAFWHQSGTAKMGRDEMSVVDGQLRVYGVDRLCIADASILPCVTTGNTMAPCVVIGEQAAAFLQNEGYDAEISRSRILEATTR